MEPGAEIHSQAPRWAPGIQSKRRGEDIISSFLWLLWPDMAAYVLYFSTSVAKVGDFPLEANWTTQGSLVLKTEQLRNSLPMPLILALGNWDRGISGISDLCVQAASYALRLQSSQGSTKRLCLKTTHLHMTRKWNESCLKDKELVKTEGGGLWKENPAKACMIDLMKTSLGSPLLHTMNMHP